MDAKRLSEAPNEIRSRIKYWHLEDYVCVNYYLAIILLKPLRRPIGENGRAGLSSFQAVSPRALRKIERIAIVA